MNFKKNKKLFLCQTLALFFLFSVFLDAKAQVNGENIKVLSESAGNRIAPGEFLPVSVKLVNFGSEKRIDVIINYKIFNNADKDIYQQKEIYAESETVAVETTASFIKRIQIPYNFKPGFYTLVTVLNYPYQENPAISKTPFFVEEKIGGFFKSDLTVYSIFLFLVIAVVVLLAVLITYILSRHKKIHSATIQYDYSNKPKDQIIYYEILSGIVSQMRLRIGDKALKIAKENPELEINEKTGEIIEIKKDPAKIVSLLISEYEKLIGQPISFDVRRK